VERKVRQAARHHPPPCPMVALMALPVVSCMEDHIQLNSDLGTSIPLTESTDATIAMMQDNDFCQEAGMNSEYYGR
jgi:hypothetical protein